MLLHSSRMPCSESSSSPNGSATPTESAAPIESSPTNEGHHYPGIKSHSVSGTSSPHDPVPRRYSLAIETPESHSKHPNTPFSAWLVQSLTEMPKQCSVTDLTEFGKVLETSDDLESPLSPIKNSQQRLSVCSATSNDSVTYSESGSNASVDGWSQSTPTHKHHRCKSTAIKFNTPRYC